MFLPEPNVRIWLYAKPTDMRKSFNGLCSLVSGVLSENPTSGALFVFINRRKTHIKILYFYGSGFCIWFKRLEQGQFNYRADGDLKRTLDWTQLKLLLDGLEVKKIRQYKRYSHPKQAFFESGFGIIHAMNSDLPSDKKALAQSIENDLAALHALQKLSEENGQLKDEIASLKNRIAWFEKQIFGQKSEKRVIENPHQASLLSEPTETEIEAAPEKDVSSYKRGTAKKARPDDCITDSGLRFSDDVPVEKIEVVPAELTGPEADQYQVIDTRITRKLAQHPASFVVLEYHLPVLKKKTDAALDDTPDLITTPMLEQVLEGSIADVSLIAGLLINKFLYHMPLHQQLIHNGITVARSSLTNWTKRAIELLRPIVEALLLHILQSKVLAIDETPVKSGRQQKGKMKTAYFWPLHGEDHEVVFTYSESRGKQHIIDTLSNAYSGTLVTDGYAAYAKYAEKTEGVTHAQCWVHARRYLVNARDSSPTEIDEALEIIGQLYQVEKQIREQNLTGEKKRKARLDKSKPKVDQVFEWINTQCQRLDLTPKHPLTKALNYIRVRETELRVFLEDPDVPMDTNHLEREIRPIPMGRKNWLCVSRRRNYDENVKVAA